MFKIDFPKNTYCVSLKPVTFRCDKFHNFAGKSGFAKLGTPWNRQGFNVSYFELLFDIVKVSKCFVTFKKVSLRLKKFR